MIVQDTRTMERFEVYAQRSGLAQLRSLDNPGAPARTETNAGLAKDYDVVPATGPAGADDSEIRVLRERDRDGTALVAQALALSHAERDVLADEIGVDDPDLLRSDRPGLWRRLYEVER